jgi:hypothetical protein
MGLLGFDVHVARAEEPKLTATMQCDRAAEPGRVRCSVEAGTTSDRSISWADVALLELPDFTAALKGRIGPSDATTKDATSQRWAFGLVARRTGQGEARARVRALLCERELTTGDAAAPRCSPVTVDVKAIVHVG